MTFDAHADRLDLLVLSWLWYQPAPVRSAKITSALKPFHASPEMIGASLIRQTGAGTVEETRQARKGKPGDYRITAAGQQSATKQLSLEVLPVGKTPFNFLRDFALPAIALDLPIPKPEKPAQSAFNKLLPIAVCARHFSLDIPLLSEPAAKLALVKLALSKANGTSVGQIHLKKLPTGELPALVAGPLLGEPNTTAAKIEKLIEQKAREILNITKAKDAKISVVRRWLTGGVAGKVVGRVASATLSLPAQDSVAEASQPAPPPAIPPGPVDLKAFSQHVLHSAKTVAHSSPRAVSNLGDKVLVHFVWQHYRHHFGDMPLADFKKHLSDANGDLLILVREDLIPDQRRSDFVESEVRRGSSTFHYIRIGSLGDGHA